MIPDETNPNKSNILGGGTIKIAKMIYPSLSLVSAKIETFEFPLKPDGTLDEEAARNAYKNYQNPLLLDNAIKDAYEEIAKKKSKLEEAVEEPHKTKRKTRKKEYGKDFIV